MVFNSDGVMARDQRMYTSSASKWWWKKREPQTGYESVAFGLTQRRF